MPFIFRGKSMNGRDLWLLAKENRLTWDLLVFLKFAVAEDPTSIPMKLGLRWGTQMMVCRRRDQVRSRDGDE